MGGVDCLPTGNLSACFYAFYSQLTFHTGMKGREELSRGPNSYNFQHFYITSGDQILIKSEHINKTQLNNFFNCILKEIICTIYENIVSQKDVSSKALHEPGQRCARALQTYLQAHQPTLTQLQQSVKK